MVHYTRTRQPGSEQGFSLVEAMVATSILSVALVSLADLFGMATRANMASRELTRAAILAEQKMEQLHSLAWAVDEHGGAVSDVASNLAAFGATGHCRAVDTGAAVGLTPSPSGVLAENVDGYVDYVDAHGCGLGGGVVPPAGSCYVRRWSVEPSDAGPDTLVLRVLVTDRGLRTAAVEDGSASRKPGEVVLTSVKTRRVP